MSEGQAACDEHHSWAAGPVLKNLLQLKGDAGGLDDALRTLRGFRWDSGYVSHLCSSTNRFLDCFVRRIVT